MRSPYKIDILVPLPGTDPHNPLAVDKDFVEEMHHRTDWPFKNMNVGDHVLISHADWKRAKYVINNRRHSGLQDFEWKRGNTGVHVWCTHAVERVVEAATRKNWGFSEFKVGDYRMFPAEDYARMRAAAYQFTHRKGWKFEFKRNAAGCAVRRIA